MNFLFLFLTLSLSLSRALSLSVFVSLSLYLFLCLFLSLSVSLSLARSFSLSLALSFFWRACAPTINGACALAYISLCPFSDARARTQSARIFFVLIIFRVVFHCSLWCMHSCVRNFHPPILSPCLPIPTSLVISLSPSLSLHLISVYLPTCYFLFRSGLCFSFSESLSLSMYPSP